MAKMERIRVSSKDMIANNHEMMDGFCFVCCCWSCSSRWRQFPHDSIGVSYQDSSQPQGGLRTTLRAPKRLNFEAAMSQPEQIYECLFYQIGV